MDLENFFVKKKNGHFFMSNFKKKLLIIDPTFYRSSIPVAFPMFLTLVYIAIMVARLNEL